MAENAGNRRYRILCLDGGGIRGIMTAFWLDRLERELGHPVRRHFDLVAGTSTGSILAAAVGLEIPAAEIVKMYQDRGREVFPPLVTRLLSRTVRTLTQGISAPKYDDVGLERVLRRVFGDRLFGELPVRPTLITSYNVLSREAIVFKNTHPRYLQIPIWEIVKASSSAPAYFPAHVTRIEGAKAPLVDGGVVANNPTACAIAEAVRVNEEEKTGLGLSDLVVASFGTGHSTRPISVGQARRWGPLQWAIPVIDVLMDGPAQAVSYIADKVVPKDRYFRFQTPLDIAYDDMDNADPSNIRALLRNAEKYLTEQGGEQKIRELVKLL